MKTMNKICRKCHTPMELVTEMAPDGYRPGLAAWYCAHCGAADSDLIYNLSRPNSTSDHHA